MKVGFYGKLPSYGDFIQRNVSPNLVNFWDNWLSQCIDTSKAELKDSWKQIYLTSPIWRFTINPSVASQALVTGLMMPSVDAAGRDYPFIIFCELTNHHNPLYVSSSIAPYHDVAETFLLTLLDIPRPNLDDILQHVETVYTHYKPERRVHHHTQASPHSGELFRFDSIAKTHEDEVHQCFTSQLLATNQLSISIWSYSASERLNHHFRYFQGMPSVDVFSSLLEGV